MVVMIEEEASGEVTVEIQEGLGGIVQEVSDGIIQGATDETTKVAETSIVMIIEEISDEIIEEEASDEIAIKAQEISGVTDAMIIVDPTAATVAMKEVMIGGTETIAIRAEEGPVQETIETTGVDLEAIVADPIQVEVVSVGIEDLGHRISHHKEKLSESWQREMFIR